MPLPDAVTTLTTLLGAAVDVRDIIGALRRSRDRREEETVRSLLDACDMAPADLARAARDNPALGELFAHAVDIGTTARTEAKRRALQGIVGRALMRPDGARIDEDRFLLSTLAQLEDPHLRALAELHVSVGRMSATDGRGIPIIRSVATRDIADATSWQPLIVRPIMSTLSRLGLAAEVLATGGPAGGGGADTVDRWTTTEFGELMLKWLELPEGVPVSITD